MTRITLLGAVIALSISTVVPAYAHDMSTMNNMDGHEMNASPNAMGGHMAMDAHMVMTVSREQTPQDVERAHDVIDTLRRSLAKYRSAKVALSEGYQIFLPTIPQEVYHFTDYPAAREEYTGHFDPAHPGSLLYVKQPDGEHAGEYALIGAMYSASPDYTPEQLDALIPLSVAHWHAHVNICLPNNITLRDLLRGEIGATQLDMPGTIPVAANPAADNINRRLGFMADGRFGFTGKIADAASCDAAGGHFIPQAFGWMVHVYPFNGDDLKVAFGSSVPKPVSN